MQWRDVGLDAAPDRDLAARLVALAERRVVGRMPMAYLLGEAWFAGLRFKIDARALIPRSPLAELIERRFEPWVRLKPGDRILDVGTGSGCLAVAAAHHCPGVLIDATEASRDALALAAENVAAHGLEDRVRLLEADLLPGKRQAYRVIMSNPPYVPSHELGALPPEYAHEPTEALDGGPDGLVPAARLLEGAADYLEPGGVLVVEVGLVHGALARRYPRLPVVWLEFERGGEGVFVVGREELTGSGALAPRKA